MGVVLTSPRPTHGALNWDTTLEADLSAIATAINTPADVSGTDLNAITLSGLYSGNNLTNSPDGTTGYFTLFSVYRGTTLATQLAIKSATGQEYRRTIVAGTWSAWIPSVDIDTGWVTASTGIAAGTGYTFTSAKYRKVGNRVDIAFVVTKTAAVAASSTGALASNSQPVTLPASLTPSSSNGFWSAAGGTSTALGFGYFSGVGAAVITAGTPTTGIPANTVLDCLGSYIV